MAHCTVLVPFPFDDLSGAKVRPAICQTDEITPYKHVVIAFITSQLVKAAEPTDIPVLPADADFALTGLKVPSAIRLHRLVTIHGGLIQRYLGEAPPGLKSRVTRQLRLLFGL